MSGNFSGETLEFRVPQTDSAVQDVPGRIDVSLGEIRWEMQFRVKKKRKRGVNTRSYARIDGFTSAFYIRAADIDSLVASICVFSSLGEIANASIGLRTVAVYETAEDFYGRLRERMVRFVVLVVLVISRRRFESGFEQQRGRIQLEVEQLADLLCLSL